MTITKKNNRIDFRLSDELKQSFVEACRADNTTISDDLVRYVALKTGSITERKSLSLLAEL